MSTTTRPPRVLLSHEDGLTLLDAETGEMVKDQDTPGFKRLANAGNGRDVMVITGNGWEVFNAGTQAKAHGEHVHHDGSEPGMTGVTFPGDHAGQVVAHNGRTTLFADGTGTIQTFDSAHLDKATRDLTPVMDENTTEDPHHGVALELADGTLFTTQGTEESRNVMQVIDRESGDVKAETRDCPGSHVEAAAQPTAAGDVVVMGCENGPVVYRDGEFHRVDVEPEEAVERPTKVALIDSRTDELATVELGSSSWFRSLGQAEDGSGVVLTYDGELTVIDEETGEKLLEKDLEFAPVEMAVVTGEPESVAPEEGAHDADGEGHEGHDH